MKWCKIRWAFYLLELNAYLSEIISYMLHILLLIPKATLQEGQYCSHFADKGSGGQERPQGKMGRQVSRVLSADVFVYLLIISSIILSNYCHS